MIGMKDKVKAWGLTIATGFFLIMSVVLWIYTLTNDQQFSHVSVPQSTNQIRIRNHITKSIHDIYIPTSSFTYINGQLEEVYDSKKNLLLKFAKQMSEAKNTGIELVSRDDKRYSALMTDPNYIQFTYPGPITFDLFINNPQSHKNDRLNRVFVKKTNNTTIYAGNDQTNTIYKVGIKNANFDGLESYIHHAQVKVPIVQQKFAQGYFPVYLQANKVNIYSYLVDAQPATYFVSRLLGNSGITIKNNHFGDTVYNSGFYKHLEVMNESDQISNRYQYVNYEKVVAKNLTERQVDSLYYVNQLGIMEQDLRYFDYNQSTVEYLNYIEGIPVFSNSQFSQINVKFNSDGVTTDFNSTNLQIPIPFDGHTKRLPAMQTVINALNDHGLTKKDIQKIVIGYTLVKDNNYAWC